MNTTKQINVAVALNFDGTTAPRVVAKGRGDVAAAIVNCARQHGVPLNADPSTVEVLAQLDIGQQIPESIFTAVAEIIAFAYQLQDELATNQDRD